VPETRQGLTEARQRGFWATSAPWIAFVDDDCILDSGWVANAIDFLERHPQCSGFNGRNILVLGDHQPRSWVAPVMFAGFDPGGSNEVVAQHTLCGAGLVLNRDAVVRSGWLDSPRAPDRRGRSLVSGGDNELAMRAGAAGGDQWFVPQCELTHVVDPSRLSLGYLLRLNFRLAEAGPLSNLMRTSHAPRVWRRAMLRGVAAQFAWAVGVRADPTFPSKTDARAHLLAGARAIGHAVGYVKLARRSDDELEPIAGLATPDGIVALTRVS